MEWRGRLGVPYQGSKNAIARDIISILPSGRRFVDLFAGGCAMTHAAILSGKYERFLANDKHGFGVRLFMDAIAGKCNGKWREWVSREEFYRRKGTDPLIALCWSFSNNGRDYLYSHEEEDIKCKAQEYIVSEIDSTKCSHKEYRKIFRRYRIEKKLKSNPEMQSFFQVESLEQLERLQKILGNGRIEERSQSYQDVDIKRGDIIYCDPPYEKAQRYNTNYDFDHEAFWRWCESRDFPVFVSEYIAPEGFIPIWRKGKYRQMSNKGATGKAVEKVFVAERWADRYQSDLFPDF